MLDYQSAVLLSQQGKDLLHLSGDLAATLDGRNPAITTWDVQNLVNNEKI